MKGQREEVSLTIHVKTDKLAEDIKPVSLERSILTNVNVHLDDFFLTDTSYKRQKYLESK